MVGDNVAGSVCTIRCMYNNTLYGMNMKSFVLVRIFCVLSSNVVKTRQYFHSINTRNSVICLYIWCYVIVCIVSYREITNKMFSLTQSKPYISKFLGPIKVIKKDLNNA